MKLGDQHTLKKLIQQSQPCRVEKVAFFGGADIDKEHPVYQQAYEIARLVAKEGKTVINGGGPGVMLATTQGAQSVGGQTLSVAFQPDKEDMPEFSEEASDNHPDLKIIMPDLPTRQAGLIDLADLFVIFKGGTGTLSEWTWVWLLAHLRIGHHKPLILYGDFWHEVLEMINKNFFIDGVENQVYTIVSTPDEFLKALYESETEIARRCL